MFNQALSLATGDEDLINSPKFSIYYIDDKIQVVIPNMIADSFGISTSRVSRSLQGIGMAIEHKRVRLATKEGTISRKVRAIQVPNQQIWNEILQRYYFNEDGETTPECPDCLKGPKFITRHESQKSLFDTSTTNDKISNTDKIDTPTTREVEQVEQVEQKNQGGDTSHHPGSGTTETTGTKNQGGEQSVPLVPLVPLTHRGGIPENDSSTNMVISNTDFSQLAGVRPDEYITPGGGVWKCVLCGNPAAHRLKSDIKPLPLCTRHYREWKGGWKEGATS